jgi:GT2 family glycosyltransferase
MSKIHAIVVTYNRRALLEVCLKALAVQTRPPDHILLLDNASTDDTQVWIESSGWKSDPRHEYVRLADNVGGAGGFTEGMQRCFASDADAVWMMDDDAEPEADSLETLLAIYSTDTDIYGSIAITHDRKSFCWPLVSMEGVEFKAPAEVPDKVSVAMLPFLGILIPRKVVEVNGLPDPGYFIQGDDAEFCFRARKRGMRIYAAGKSRLRHPPSAYYRFGFWIANPFCFRMPPWKRYYEVRNRILSTRRHSGLFRVFTVVLAANAFRLSGALWNEPQKAKQALAFFAGTVDGLLLRKGRRHQLWHLG